MKVTTEKTEPGVAALTVELPPEEFDRAVDRAWQQLANRANIPGFRRGKAPRHLVERHVGRPAIDEEALKRLLPERYDAAVDETGIFPIERPQFDIVQLERGKPLIFKATVAVRPTAELGDYQSISVERGSVAVGDEDVDRVVSRLREGQAEWVPVADRGVEAGDQVIGDLTIQLAPREGDEAPRKTERKDTEIILGEHGFPEGFDQAVIGAQPGDTRSFDLSWQLGPVRPVADQQSAADEQSVTNDAESTAEAGSADDAGTDGAPGMAVNTEAEANKREATFTLTVKDIKQKRLPELDDAFAQSLGEHPTMEALKDDVRLRLYDEALRGARVEMENKTVDAAIKQATFEVPDRLIEAETDALAEERSRALLEQRLTVERYLQLLGQTQEQWRGELREQALRQIKARVLLDAVAEKEALDVNPAEVNEEIERTAQAYGAQADQVRRSLGTDESQRRIQASLRRHKAIEKLVSYSGGYPEGTPPQGALPAEAVAVVGGNGIEMSEDSDSAASSAPEPAGSTESDATGATDSPDAAGSAGTDQA